MKAIEVFPHVNDLRNRFFPAYKKLTEEQLEWKTEGYKNNISFLLRHTAQAGDWFLRGVIQQEKMMPRRKRELDTRDKLFDYLEWTRENTLSFLESQDISILQETRQLPEGYRGEPIENPTIGWILHRVFQHEVYHLGQVNLMMRLQGIEPPNSKITCADWRLFFGCKRSFIINAKKSSKKDQKKP